MKRMLLVVGVVLTAVSLVAGAQAPSADKWKSPRTPDGHPDLQGIWTTHTYTPLERPARYAGKEFLTEEETAELTKLLTQPGVDPLVLGIFGATDEQRRNRVVQNDPTHYDNALWLAAPQKALSSRRTSLITDPPDGRLPALTPEARQRAAAARAAGGFDSYENRPLQERCIMWTHEGPPMMPPPYNDVLQIIQTPGYFVVFRELATAPRLIPTAGGPQHLPEQVRQWAGDSRGRWEGDTLVVDTTNFNGRTTFQGSSAALHIVERFTRVSVDRILYQFTVDDPQTWARPWTAELPMLQTEGPLYEYACHEGNYGLANTLSGARFTDREAAKAPAPTPVR
jgi:hypothetical protein